MCFCVLNEHCLSLSLGHRFLGSHRGSRLNVEELNESIGVEVTFEAGASLYDCGECLCLLCSVYVWLYMDAFNHRAFSRWGSWLFVALSSPASATLCPWKHNEIFKCSTTWYIHFMSSVLHHLSTAAKVSMRGVVGLPLVKDVLSRLLSWNSPWFIKWNTTVMPSQLI